MARLILIGLAIAMGVILAGPGHSQTNPGFNPDISWCNTQGALAQRGPTKWQCLTPGTAGQALLSGGPGALAYWNTVTGIGTVTSISGSGGTTGMTLSGGPITGAGTLTIGGTLGVANGGTGQTNYTNGQLLIGNTTGNTLAKGTLTAGDGIAVTNGAGAITIKVNVPTVANNTELTALSTANFSTIYRSGFAVAGDAPTVTYNASNAPCSLGSGNGDGGAQVKSSDNKCWIMSNQSLVYDARIWGVVADNVTDDFAAWNKIATFVNTQTTKRVKIVFSGVSRITDCIAFTKGVTIAGENTRAAILTPEGSCAISFIGTSSTGRISNAELTDFIIDSTNQANGTTAVIVDFAQDFRMNILIANASNAMTLRQSGNTIFGDKAFIDGVRDGVGFYAYAPLGTRNGETDKIDVISFTNLIIQGRYVPGDPAPTSQCMVLEGNVHTVTGVALRCLSIGTGITFKNTGVLDQKFAPSFMHFDIETENTYYQGVNALQVNTWRGLVFSASSTSENCVYMETVITASITPYFSNCWKNGIEINGSKWITISDPDISLVGKFSSGTFDGIRLTAGDAITISAGRIGPNTALAPYAETTRYGVANIAATNVQITNTDLRGNVLGPYLGNGMNFVNAPGVDSNASVPSTVPSLDYTFPANVRDRTIQLYGGTGVTAYLNTQVAGSSSGNTISIAVPANMSLRVTSATAPIAMIITK